MIGFDSFKNRCLKACKASHDFRSSAGAKICGCIRTAAVNPLVLLIEWWKLLEATNVNMLLSPPCSSMGGQNYVP